MPRPLGVTTVSVLRAIHRGHRYGADIIGETEMGGGTVYKILHRLEARGSIEGEWEDPEVAERERRPRRRFYRLTAAGERALADAVARMRELTRGVEVTRDGGLAPSGEG